ncbi:MazG family protein [Nocardioides sp. JQ2195]|uniref:MazG family protein n=1 Tax=Nocardioides sp. JQ2195 TaxID=2592334 RepID=UPI00143ED3A8|nr:MazG family protein [Nocardioides sp. JQ2195]QIX27831.1 MazG family protein [Nocardioides sp. JQ2195]
MAEPTGPPTGEPTDGPTGESLVELTAVMTRMRRACAWKAGQTHRSLARFLLEEAHETLEAIDTGDAEHLREELGDLLLQVWFHAEIASETGAFTIDDVATDLIEKMVRRNPHVFGDAPASDDSVEINEVWQAIKAQEKQRDSVFDGLPPTLPALLLADKVLDRLERSGRSVAPPGDELGDRLLALVAEARAEGVDPEQALRDAVRRVAGDA